MVNFPIVFQMIFRSICICVQRGVWFANDPYKSTYYQTFKHMMMIHNCHYL